jgi:hypothetical protein
MARAAITYCWRRRSFVDASLVDTIVERLGDAIDAATAKAV